jgi:Flp pilus assembly protein TadD
VVAVLALLGAGRTWVWLSDERLWREALRRAPDKARPMVQLAHNVRAEEALELLNQAAQLEPYNPEIPAATGKVLLDEEQYDAALAELSRALLLDPRNPVVLNNHGVALAALSQIEGAEQDFEQAIAIDPGFAEARENLSRLPGR